ncbi:hypothetical protein P8452_36089 [Trifolium repens]|nr:hypothetical protein P8452_36089 [Trifolium repens]
MAASGSKHENVELVFPPEEVTPGERIWFGSEDEKDNQPLIPKPLITGLMQAEPATALSLIKVGALQNATAAEPGALQTYLAVVKWKSPTPGP